MISATKGKEYANGLGAGNGCVERGKVRVAMGDMIDVPAVRLVALQHVL